MTQDWNSLFCVQSSTIRESAAAALKLSLKILFALILKPVNFQKAHLDNFGFVVILKKERKFQMAFNICSDWAKCTTPANGVKDFQQLKKTLEQP